MIFFLSFHHPVDGLPKLFLATEISLKKAPVDLLIRRSYDSRRKSPDEFLGSMALSHLVIAVPGLWRTTARLQRKIQGASGRDCLSLPGAIAYPRS
jgi:hypothetical protein